MECLGIHRSCCHEFVDKNGIAFLGAKVNLNSADNLKKLATLLSATQNKSVIVLVNEIEAKAAVVLAISENLVQEKGWQAPQIIKEKIIQNLNTRRILN